MVRPRFAILRLSIKLIGERLIEGFEAYLGVPGCVEGVPPRGEWQEPNTEYLAAKFSTYMDRRFSVGPISARWQLKEPAN